MPTSISSFLFICSPLPRVFSLQKYVVKMSLTADETVLNNITDTFDRTFWVAPTFVPPNLRTCVQSFASYFQIALRSLCHQGTTSSQNLGKMSHSPVSFHRRGQYSKLHGKRSSPIRLTSWLAATCPKGKVMLQSTKGRYWATVVWAWQAPSSSCPTSWPLTQGSTAAASRPAQRTMEPWKQSQWGWL